MSFINNQKNSSIICTYCTELSGFKMQNKVLVYQCSCGQIVNCYDLLKDTLFPLNALCDSRFQHCVYEIEKHLVSYWDNKFSYVIPVLVDKDKNSLLLSDLIYMITSCFDISLIPSMLFCQLTCKLVCSDTEEFPIILYNGLHKIRFGINLPLVPYFEKGISSLTYECKNCFNIFNFDLNGVIKCIK